MQCIDIASLKHLEASANQPIKAPTDTITRNDTNQFCVGSAVSRICGSYYWWRGSRTGRDSTVMMGDGTPSADPYGIARNDQSGRQLSALKFVCW